MSCSCAVFVNGSVLAYFLADQGFDVWLPNNRGTTFSRQHKEFEAGKNSEKYWNFSPKSITYQRSSQFPKESMKLSEKYSRVKTFFRSNQLEGNFNQNMNALMEESCEDITNYIESIIKEKGYPLEKHTVTTEDGYMNLMFRIPYGRRSSCNNNIPRPPVMLVHGMSCSSAVFVNGSVLAFFLADQGFDVWLPNNRGTTFSRQHKEFDADKDKEKYWNFSWHEIGIYDTAAFIDHILQVTGFEKLHFLGHSQGATVFAVLLSERPQYNDKIALSCLLGVPIIFQNNRSPRVTFISKLFIGGIEKAHRYLRVPIYQMPFVTLARLFGKCAKPKTLWAELYWNLFFLVAGNPDIEQVSEVDIPKFSITTPNTFSVLQPYHYLQLIRSGRFAKYDHGPEKNEEIYGSRTPPVYDLSKITAPVAFFNSKNDMYYNPKDTEKLEEMFGNVVFNHLVEDDSFNHGDFLFAKDSIELLYYHMIRLMKQYNPEFTRKSKICVRRESTAVQG